MVKFSHPMYILLGLDSILELLMVFIVLGCGLRAQHPRIHLGQLYGASAEGLRCLAEI